ncbi:MAG: hypothetical protein ACD_24C00114G0001 [uncultured bacterium]|nr:MAG: hypothetical protein ACD_24C00114G0001 [uncultured bacterium]
MPIIGAYYLPLSIYILTFYLILFKLLRRNYKDIHLLCFLLIYGVTSFIYYLGFNVPDHLLTVIHPSLILILIYCWWLYKNHHFFNSLSAIYKTIFITLAIIYLGFSVWPPNKFLQNTLGKIYQRYSKSPQKYYKWDYPGTNIYLADDDGRNFVKAAEVIKKYVPDEKDVLIVSRYDTLLLVMAQKTSLVNYPLLEYEITDKTEMEKTINKIKNIKPKYIFVFSKNYKQMSNDNLTEIWEGIKKNYTFVENAGAVDVYKYR